MVALPKYIMIGPHRISIERTAELDEDTIGLAVFRSNKMLICAGLPPTIEVETVLHEIAHFMLYGVLSKDKDTECVANVFGRGLASFIRDNPKCVRWLQKVLAEENK
jgi:hypothetical protein